MAKEAKKKAGAFETENAGLLSGLFAEENEFDRRALLRIGTWGATAVGAVILAVISNQWSLGWRREQVAAADFAHQAQQIKAVSRESQNETRRLAAAIETLNNDRDRLFSRVTVLEQGLDSVTGALAKQNSAPAPAATPPFPQASVTPLASPAAPAKVAAAQTVASAAPVPGPVRTTTAAGADKPRADATKADAAPPPAVRALATAPAASNPPLPPPPSAAASLMAKSMMGPPEPAAPKLVAPGKRAEAKAADVKAPAVTTAEAKGTEKSAEERIEERADTPAAPAAAALPSPSPAKIASASPKRSDEPDQAMAKVDVQRTDFAVELGSANSLPGLRALWREVRHVNADLSPLSPIIVVKEGNNGLGMWLHLAAGPLKDAAAAAKICAALAERRRNCETTVYDGQRLAMKDDEAKPLSAKPLSAKPLPEAKQGFYKRSKHAKKEEEPPPPPPPPPKPEPTSAFSALFGRH